MKTKWMKSLDDFSIVDSILLSSAEIEGAEPKLQRRTRPPSLQFLFQQRNSSTKNFRYSKSLRLTLQEISGVLF